MNKNDKHEILEKVFSEAGLFLTEEDYDEELQIDSLQFITLVVGVEKAFSIEIDENHYIDNSLKTFNDFLKILN